MSTLEYVGIWIILTTQRVRILQFGTTRCTSIMTVFVLEQHFRYLKVFPEITIAQMYNFIFPSRRVLSLFSVSLLFQT